MNESGEEAGLAIESRHLMQVSDGSGPNRVVLRHLMQEHDLPTPYHVELIHLMQAWPVRLVRRLWLATVFSIGTATRRRSAAAALGHNRPGPNSRSALGLPALGAPEARTGSAGYVPDKTRLERGLWSAGARSRAQSMVRVGGSRTDRRHGRIHGLGSRPRPTIGPRRATICSDRACGGRQEARWSRRRPSAQGPTGSPELGQPEPRLGAGSPQAPAWSRTAWTRARASVAPRPPRLP
jgi:hypothetical protein